MCNYRKGSAVYMLNEVRLIGRLKGDIYIQKPTGEEVGILELEIEENSDDSNVIQCCFPSKETMRIFSKYREGAMLEVKGKLQVARSEKYNKDYLEVIAEEVNFVK